MHGTLSLSNISIEESHQLIDAAIAQHQASILALKSQRNSLAPISRLPPETLFEIFSLVKQLEEEVRTPALEWITVTHVNSHWRRVAINSLSLWANVPLCKPQWVEEMLKRSKDAGLEIEANLGPDTGRSNDIPGLRAALQHSSRIKRLSLQDIYDASQWNDLQKALPKFAPRLEYLRMTAYGRRDRGIFLSKEVFCKAERLRHLVLINCTLNWNTHLHLLRSLTHLTLYNLHSWPNGMQFMDALKGMPYLELLYITNTLPVDPTWDSDRVHLAYLRTLSIHSKHTQVQAFFHYVTFPPTAMVKVKCTIQDTSTAHAEKSECADVVLNLSQSYSNSISDHVFRSLIYRPFSLSRGTEVRLKLFTYVVADEQANNFDFYVEASANLELSFEWTVTPPTHYINRLMISIFSGVLPIQDAAMHILSLGYSYTETEAHRVETIAHTFGTMPQVCSVALQRFTSAPFLKAVKLGSYVEETGAMDLVEQLYFPNLSSLYFQGAKFSESGLSEDKQDSTCVDPTCISIESLRDYLIQRSNSGAKIQKLTFEKCENLGQHDIHSLSAAVGKLDWDQYRLESNNDYEDD